MDNLSNNNDFEELLNNSLNNSLINKSSFNVGDYVNGNVVQIDNNYIFVDIGYKTEAIIDISEFFDENNNININIGDDISAYILKISSDEIILTSKIGLSNVNNQILFTAYKNQIPVYGKVLQKIKGGYNVAIGDIIAFCPISQIGINTENDITNNIFDFIIIKYENNGRNIVLSRNPIIEKQKQIEIDNFEKNYKIGDVVEVKVDQINNAGIVTKYNDYIYGFIPKSEISYSKINNLSRYKVNDSIKAKIIELDLSNEKLILSIKQTKPQPWDLIDNYKIGKVYTGKVTNIINKGVFVEIDEGLEGFIPLMYMSYTERVKNPQDVCSKGDIVKVKIIEINKENKRLILELQHDIPNPWEQVDNTFDSRVQEAKITDINDKGVMVLLENNIIAFVPKNELFDKLNSTQYQKDNKIKVIVKEYIPEKRKCIASEKMAIEIEQRNAFKQYSANSSQSQITLGHLLKDKLEKFKK